jgi:hypothetical protein
MSDDFYCYWQEDQDGIWNTGCGWMYQFFDGGPLDNNHKYCQYCGRFLYELSYGDTVEDEFDHGPYEDGC